jgi:hypothetical protein
MWRKEKQRVSKENNRENTYENTYWLLSAPYFFVFFFLWAFATLRVTSKHFELASLKSQRICGLCLKDNRLPQHFDLVNIKAAMKAASFNHVTLQHRFQSGLGRLRP